MLSILSTALEPQLKLQKWDFEPTSFWLRQVCQADMVIMDLPKYMFGLILEDYYKH